MVLGFPCTGICSVLHQRLLSSSATCRNGRKLLRLPAKHMHQEACSQTLEITHLLQHALHTASPLIHTGFVKGNCREAKECRRQMVSSSISYRHILYSLWFSLTGSFHKSPSPSQLSSVLSICLSSVNCLEFNSYFSLFSDSGVSCPYYSISHSIWCSRLHSFCDQPSPPQETILWLKKWNNKEIYLKHAKVCIWHWKSTVYHKMNSDLQCCKIFWIQSTHSSNLHLTSAPSHLPIFVILGEPVNSTLPYRLLIAAKTKAI